jgi:hypothetical protein
VREIQPVLRVEGTGALAQLAAAAPQPRDVCALQKRHAARQHVAVRKQLVELHAGRSCFRACLVFIKISYVCTSFGLGMQKHDRVRKVRP